MDKKTYLLIFILALAVFLRVWGIDYGLPYFLIGDERTLVYGALKMGELRTLIPAFHPEEFRILYYAPLMSYVYLVFLAPFILIQYLIGGFSSFNEISNYFILNPAPIWLVARVVNALMGLATVYLMYLLGRKIANVWIGLISASFLAFSFLHVQFSHFTRLWTPTLFFVLLIMLLSFYIYKSPQRKYYLWMGVIGGLSFGVNYVAPLAMFIFMIAHFLFNKTSFYQKLKDKNLWLTAFIFVLLAAVFILLYPQLFLGWTGMEHIDKTLTTSRSFTEFLYAFISYLKVLFFYEPVIFIFSLLGLIFFWFRSKKIFFIFLSWPIVWISALYFLLHVQFDRPTPHYIMVILPWLILSASYFIYHLIVKRSALIKIFVLALIFVYPFTTAIQYDYLLNQKDTRILAKEWVEENIPSGSGIVSNVSSSNPIPTKESILFQKELDEDSLRAGDHVLLSLADEKYPQPSYNLLKLAYFSEREEILPDLAQFIKDNNYQYFLLSFWDESDLSQEEREVVKKTQLLQEFKQGQTIKAEDINAAFFQPVFTIFSLDRLGPTVRIYEL